MGASRKLRKTIQASREPMILFVPDEKNTYVEFIKSQPDIITVTDRKLYDRVLEGINQAIQSGRPGVIRGGNDEL